MTSIATTDDAVAITSAEMEYARLLYRSGYHHRAIAEALGQHPGMLESIVRRAGWTRATVARPRAQFALRVPVLVRCAGCSARFGEELGASRPCPHCGALERGEAK